MTEQDLILLKKVYREWLAELEIETSKKEKVSELEEKLLSKGSLLSTRALAKLSRPLQDFIHAATKVEQRVSERTRNKVVKRSYYLVDKYGFNTGSKRSYVAALLANGNWWTRSQLLSAVKREIGECSQYTIDFVETYLRKKKYDLRVSKNKEGKPVIKLFE